ncbi:MAG: helix-turn-helix domain-containing protein [Alphaproteobacteria bacterium]|jgi:HTH-type transcriptional regulator/antitoxin HigA|nr:helix-turn-helix domain-containing protein [Alphaproteobacteria bacterium]
MLPGRSEEAALEIKPIKTEADHGAALKRLELLWGAEPDTPEGDELDVLATLIEAYEDRHHSIPEPDPIEAIKFRMEQQGLTRKDLEPLIGPRGRVSEVLSGRRSLTLPMIRRLSAALKIPADVLIKDTAA